MQNQVGRLTITDASGQPFTLEMVQALLLALIPACPDPQRLLIWVNELLGGEWDLSTLEPLLAQRWLARYVPPVPPPVAQGTTPELLTLTETGWEMQQVLLPHSDAVAYADTTGLFLESTWMQWATANAIMAGNTCKDALYGYQVCWNKHVDLVGVMDIGILAAMDHLVLAHPRQGRKVVRLGVFCQTSPHMDTETMQENLEDSGRAYLDAAYYITLNATVAADVAATLERVLAAGYRPPHGLSIGVFTLEALVGRWLPGPEHWLEWSGQPPAQLRPAIPTTFCKPKPVTGSR